MVPAVDEVELDLSPQQSRSQLFEGVNVVFVQPDNVHEQFIQMGGGKVLHVTTEQSLQTLISLHTMQPINSLAIFRNTTAPDAQAKLEFDVDPSYVFITDVDIVNAVLTNVR